LLVATLNFSARLVTTGRRKNTGVRREVAGALNYTFVLHLATEEQIFEIAPSFLPHHEIYLVFEAFRTGELLENRRAKKSSRE
jgi:hypothetical protein